MLTVEASNARGVNIGRNVKPIVIVLAIHARTEHVLVSLVDISRIMNTKIDY